MKRIPAFTLACLSGLAAAGGWHFDPPIGLTVDAAPHFHHLNGAGRRHVAAGSEAVAVAWEDDHTGTPQIYFARKRHADTAFGETLQLSTGEEAYEPAIISAGADRWLAAWEQDGRIMAAAVDPDGPGPVLQLAANARQVSLAADSKGRLAAAWAASGPAGQLVQVALLNIVDRTVAVLRDAVPVAPLKDHAYQGYPALTWSNGRLVVAWEDRRAGHTRLFHAARGHGGEFTAERQLNEHNNPPPGEALPGVGLGSGVMRVALATDDAGVVRAIWLDKRNPASGYAVWGAASGNGGTSFGENAIVQDDLGSSVAQWHAALSGGPGGFVAAWDDTREAWDGDAEPGDVIISDVSAGGWNSDLVVPVASGDGYQGSPALSLGPDGGLHLVWIARDDLAAPTRLFYSRAKRLD